MRWLTLLMCGAVACAASADSVIHVSPDGDDRWSGRLPLPRADRSDGPKATLTAARDAARSLPRSPDRPARIILANGIHRVTEPLLLDPRDSHTIFEAAEGARPVVSGGKPITDWRVEPDGTWTATLPPSWRFEQLWVNGRRAARARHPNKFFSFLNAVREEATGPVVNRRASRARQFLTIPAEDAQYLQGLSDAEMKAVQIMA
ncbi:MAG: hypothetical protein N2039_01295, partial [Gemmataceae bacterium]|nr:hypothetical protein [Gemmataceae bacterium]